MNKNQILIGIYRQGVQLCNVNVDGTYDLTPDADFNLLPGVSVNSMVALSNNRYLCAVSHPGSLQLIDVNSKTTSLYAPKFKGEKL